METVYKVIEYILPFKFMEYDFMKNAFLAILVVSPLFGIVGTMIVNKKMAFFSDALGHSALTGIALGTLIGVSNFSISMIIFATLFALLLNVIKRKNTASTDTVISVFSSSAIALGLIILSRNGGLSKYSSYLVGDILSVSLNEIAILIIVLIITFLTFLVIFNKLLAISINEPLAKSRGIKVVLIDNIFTIMISVIVMLSIKWVGLLMINALLILPAAASRIVSKNMKEYITGSILISLITGITGLLLSFVIKTATGPTIVMLLAITFFAMVLFNKRK